MSQDGNEDGKSQPGFLNAVFSVISGSRRARSSASSSASSTNTDTIQDQNIGQSDGLGSQEITPDGVLSLEIRDENATPPPGGFSKNEKSFRYDEGPQTLANGGSSSGFRYFKNDEDSPLLPSSVVKKTVNAGNDSQGKGLISGLSSPVRDPSKIGFYLPDPSFPLSRPAAEYAPLTVSSSVGPRPHARDDHLHEGLDEYSIARLGQWNPQNVTQRDTKRPKERPRDRVYKQRFSMGGSSVPEFRSNVQNFDPTSCSERMLIPDSQVWENHPTRIRQHHPVSDDRNPGLDSHQFHPVVGVIRLPTVPLRFS
jgi:hypothetical protein